MSATLYISVRRVQHGQHERSCVCRCAYSIQTVSISPKFHNRPDLDNTDYSFLIAQVGLLVARKQEYDILLCSAVIAVLQIEKCCALC